MAAYYVELTIRPKDLEGLELSKAQFEGCAFHGCIFSSVDLSGCSFTECVFEGCDVSGVNVVDTSFQDCEFSQCKLLGVRFDTCRTFLLSWRMQSCQVNMSSFYSLDLTRCTFQGCSFHQADFVESNIAGVTFADCDFTGAQFERTNLEKADLRGAIGWEINPLENQVKGVKVQSSQLAGFLHQFELDID